MHFATSKKRSEGRKETVSKDEFTPMMLVLYLELSTSPRASSVNNQNTELERDIERLVYVSLIKFSRIK